MILLRRFRLIVMLRSNRPVQSLTEHRDRPYSPALLAYLSSPATLHDRIANGALTPQSDEQRRKGLERRLQHVLGRCEVGVSKGTTDEPTKGADRSD